ncbi:oligosaccharide flippase family protein [Lentimicrobium sp. L6]|uniref:lipopolysaccharide biosynthesis protein n=1 Tax=Lentimicrobium sp. L6 TaxID=2735916 RepID=UPI0015567F6F|nr:oligosaccharide flippase family protein [Lentimicrobium sp. L6]NPD83306.1 oligosaccharide flippase family protein [Lentimicrobium sp. L6]
MFKEIKQSEFAKQVATLLTGSLLAQVLPFIAEYFITRLYTAAELGIITLFTSVAVMFSIIATGRYEFAIMLPKEKEKSINVLFLALFITVIIAIVSFFVTWLLNDWVCKVQKSDELGRFLWYVPISVLAVGVFNSFNQWANRNAYHNYMAASKVSESGTTSGLNVLFGYMKLGNAGLIIAYLSGQLISTIAVLIPFFKKDKALVKEVKKSEMKSLAKKYKKFPTTNSLHAFMDMFFLSVLVFLISHYFGDDITGYYGRTYKILLAPSILIGGVVGQIFFRKISIMKSNDESMMVFFQKIILLLFLIGLPIFVIIMLFGPEIFELYLGKNFITAGTYAAILAPWIWMKFITGPLAMVPVVFDKLNASFLFGSLSNLLLVCAIVIGGSYDWSVTGTFKLLTVLQIIVLSFFILWVYSLIKKCDTKLDNI